MSSATIASRTLALKEELSDLKRQQRDAAAELKRSRQWRYAKAVPPTKDLRAIVWSEGQIKFAWFSDGKWYEYDGSWMLKDKDIIHDVSHWMETDWMVLLWWPPFGPGLTNYGKYLWSRIVGSAANASNAILPKSLRSTAQLDRKVVFYRNASTGEVMGGMPENIPSPYGYEKVVCNNVSEAERWSDRQRQWDNVKHNAIRERREQIEGPIRDEIRAEMHHKMANARNTANREFLQRALENDAKRQAPWEYRRESYLHAEAYEKGR